MKNEQRNAIADTKVLSVRMPVEEAKRLDAMAKKAGISRNDFIRMSLTNSKETSDAFPLNADEISSVCDAVRRIQCKLDRCESALEEALPAARERRPDAAAVIEDQMARCERLEDAYFELETHAAELLLLLKEGGRPPASQ